MTTVSQPMDEWNALAWKQFERQVFKLQKRIYQASQRDDVKTVHRLQRLLMRSRAARCLAVRRVTQDNQGKKTAGVDGVKSLPAPHRLALAQNLQLEGKARPLRRVWIPKPGSKERRPLGIPTICDRARQALTKLALEPEWEARFEPNSYGFRPGRSCHDAIEAIWSVINKKARYVLDTDIAKCFDRINHQALLTKLHTYPALRRAIKAWLKAGVMDGKELCPTDEGTPQGGVISPLLANVALHGLETAIRTAFPVTCGQHHNWRPHVVRYADDFVVMHEDLAVIQRAWEIANDWLAGMGLELEPKKTRIGHTLQIMDGKRGFDFLGFWVRQHPVGKTHSGCVAGPYEPRRLGFKTIITPSHEALRRHGEAISNMLHEHKMAPQGALITRLNPLVRDWSRYYATVSSKDVFAKMDHLMYLKLRRWAKFRHPHKSRHWIARKYWRLEAGRRWNFATKDGLRLIDHDRTPIVRHVKVRGTQSPFDGNWTYWSTRLGRHPELPKRVAILLHRQSGKCPWCGLFFRDGDLPEVDHIVPTSLGGRNVYDNWQLLHRHCHDQKTATVDAAARGALDTEPNHRGAG